MNELIKIEVVNGKPSVTSLQVAAAFGKEHKNVLADIRNTIGKCSDEFTELNFQPSEYTDSTGRKLPMYVLSKDGLMMVTMGYITPEAMQIKEAYIARFNEMEAALRARNNKPMLPDDYIAALRALADAEEEKKLALEQRDFYKRTKAQIGERREATAMNTASQLSKENGKLKEALGEGKTYKTVKAIPWVLDVFAPSQGTWSALGKKLRALSEEMGYEVRQVEESRYGTVGAYHVDVIARLYNKLMAEPEMMWKNRKA